MAGRITKAEQQLEPDPKFGDKVLARFINSLMKGGNKATTTRIGADQLFYCRQRGLSEEDAVSLIVNGFCKEVFKELPMEFAVEAQKLLSVSLEGAVG